MRCPQASSHSPNSERVTYPKTGSVERYYGPHACTEENGSVDIWFWRNSPARPDAAPHRL